MLCCLYYFFFFNDTATTEIYTLSLHDALPICAADLKDTQSGHAHLRLPERRRWLDGDGASGTREKGETLSGLARDRKSTRLNSSHANISYAVFCLKKKKQTI